MSKTPLSPQRRVDALLQQALALHQNGAFEMAEECYREILELRPRHVDAIQLLGTLVLQGGRLDEGVELLERAVAIEPRQAVIHSNLAFAFNALRRFDEGLASAERALALKPDLVDALNNRGNALAGLVRSVDALASFERAIALRHDSPEAWNNRACVLRDLGQPSDAVASCDRAIALRQDYADAWSNRANALSDLNQPGDAQASYRRALELRADFVDAWSNLGLTLVDLGDHAQALQCHERALAISPDHVEAHWNKALCQLEMGRFEEGWREYEWRWKRPSLAAGRRVFDVPQWLGDTPILGKTLLLHAEQGLGDTLQFCRYASLVAQRGATVLLEVPATLMRLLAGLEGVSQLIEQGQPLPPFDLHCPLLSLPLAFGTDLDTIPAEVPYLFADEIEAQAWRGRMRDTDTGVGATSAIARVGVGASASANAIAGASAASQLKVGLVWAGGNRPHVPELRKNDLRRSIGLSQLAALFDVPDVQFYSLQKGSAAQQLQAMRGGTLPEIIDYTDELDDFADTAALVANLDLVISVDTSTAHLAGAMGRPVWILNRFDTCWRWLLEREDSPWYPSARLFRQPSLGDWESVIERVRVALQELAAAR
jgi:tetratricopeptide (TPR) repeat protein